MDVQEDDVHSASRALVNLTRRLLGEVEFAALAPFLADWPQRLAPRALRASSLPVLRWLPALVAASAEARSAAQLGAAVALDLERAAGVFAWRQSYTNRDLDAQFLNNYGWTELFGLHGAFVSERLACGFLVLGPQTAYPRHRHEAEEIYVPLGGMAQWQQGDGAWRERSIGTAIHHASLEPHAMRTAQQPLLALYMWRGAGLAQSSRLDA